MTLFGSHTVDELRDLVKAKDYDVGQVQAAYDHFAPSWNSQDPVNAGDWLADWNRFKDRWSSARAKAAAAIVASEFVVGPDNLKPVEGPWQGLLRALTVVDGVQSKGDFQELHNRLVKAQGHPVDFSKQPTPIAVDTDLKVYQGADKSAKAIEAGAKAAKQAGGNFVKENWPWIAGVLVALGAGHALVKKIV